MEAVDQCLSEKNKNKLMHKHKCIINPQGYIFQACFKKGHKHRK